MAATGAATTAVSVNTQLPCRQSAAAIFHRGWCSVSETQDCTLHAAAEAASADKEYRAGCYALMALGHYPAQSSKAWC